MNGQKLLNNVYPAALPLLLAKLSTTLMLSKITLVCFASSFVLLFDI